MAKTVAKITKNLSTTAAQLDTHADRMIDRALEDGQKVYSLQISLAERAAWVVSFAQSVVDAIDGFVDRHLDRLDNKINTRINKLEERIIESGQEAEKARSVSAKINDLLS